MLVDIDSPIETKPDVKMADSDAGKYKLIKCLSLYAQAVLSLNMTKFWFDIDYTPSSDAFWIEMDSLKDYEPVLPRTKFSLDKDNKNTHYERFYLGDLERKTPIYLFTTSKFALLAKVILNNQDAKWQHIGIGGTVSKEDYNVSIQADDGSYNEKIHDMPRNVDGLIYKIAELSRTKSDESLESLTPVWLTCTVSVAETSVCFPLQEQIVRQAITVIAIRKTCFIYTPFSYILL